MFRLFTKDLGKRGENLAVKYLKKNRYKILERNFRIKSGEIDIVAKDGEQLVFVEVKTRSRDNNEFLTVSVNKGKQRRIEKTALWYIEKNKYHDMTARFDVIFIVRENGSTKIEHIKDAFE